jgi:hypothetical protein
VAAGSALYLGVLALLISGEIPILLAGLADQHRLSLARIGVAAAVEGLTMAAALAGLFLPPRHLRALAAGASLVLALADWKGGRAAGDKRIWLHATETGRRSTGPWASKPARACPSTP